MTTDSLCYLYAVLDAADAETARPGPGVDGEPVTVLRQGRLAAVVSAVDPAGFDEPALRRNLDDLGWVTDTARAHHRVIDELARVITVAPLRMATVLRGPDRVIRMLEENQARLVAVLDRLRGRQEWGVKAYLARSRSADTEPDESPADESAPGGSSARPGTAYLLRKRGQREQAERAAQFAARDAARLHELLARIAVAARRYPAQDPQLSGRPEPMLLNAAYLVAEADAKRLPSAIEDFAATDLRVELTGPWAPYSFAEDPVS